MPISVYPWNTLGPAPGKNYATSRRTALCAAFLGGLTNVEHSRHAQALTKCSAATSPTAVLYTYLYPVSLQHHFRRTIPCSSSNVAKKWTQKFLGQRTYCCTYLTCALPLRILRRRILGMPRNALQVVPRCPPPPHRMGMQDYGGRAKEIARMISGSGSSEYCCTAAVELFCARKSRYFAYLYIVNTGGTRLTSS